MFVEKAPSLQELIEELEPERAMKAFRALTVAGAASSDYIHWDKLRHLQPPDGLSVREWWLAIKLARQPLLKQIPLKDEDGTPFVYAIPDEALRLLHYVDQRCSGEIAMPEVVTADEHAMQHYLVNSLMEEAIRSSQLEGATTSRRVAKELIRSGRSPKDRSERMILNNYRALLFMREDMGEELTPGFVIELQRILTEGTLDNEDAAGRLQQPGEDRVAVYDRVDGALIHKPPPAEQLPERLQQLCDFANRKTDGTGFLHPVMRAILLHFWLGYDHPFEDGNGRTARALFYWSMRRDGYWLAEYLSISQILAKAPAQYSKSFLLTETDNRDTTYFVLYQLSVVERAVEELHRYLKRKVEEIRKVERLIKRAEGFNHRQLAVLGKALRNPAEAYTFRSHATSHSVTHETARHDLLYLQRRGLLERHKVGREFHFTAAPNLSNRLRGIAS